METSEDNERAKLKVAQPFFAGRRLTLLFLVGATFISVGIARIRGCSFDLSWLEKAIPSKPAVAVSAAQSPEAVPAPVQKAPSFEHLKRLPVSGKEPARFRGIQKTLVVPLKPDEWSREIEVPRHPSLSVRFEIAVQPDNGFFLWFKENNKIIEGKPKGAYVDLGQRSGPMRFLGASNGQTATITISTKPPTLSQNP